MTQDADPAAPAAPACASLARRRVSRRRLLLGAAGLGGVAVVSGLAGFELGTAHAAAGSGEPDDASSTVPFDGPHQAGVATPAQDRLAFAAFDVLTGDRTELAAMLRAWTDAARRMAAGENVSDQDTSLLAPPLDTGEAVGLAPGNLTLTFGAGPSLFDQRFGLGSRRPAALIDLPALPGDDLEPARSGGDLSIQACSDDPQVAFHAIRNLARLGRGTVALRWMQLGFGRTSSTSSAQTTPRNLMGFKDGTNNIVAEDQAAFDQHVWVGAGDTDQPWMVGGSYLVARRIRMLVESWDRTSLGEQQNVIGRFKSSGAPLSGTAEHDAVDLTAVGADGRPTIPATAHIRLAGPAENNGVRILRRGYSYTDGIDPVTGELDAGLFFICFQKDPAAQFVALQQRLGTTDALDEYIKHTGSAVFACPPGTQPGQDWSTHIFD